MITLANIRRAVYYLNKRIDLLEQNSISGGGTSGGSSSQDYSEIRGRIEALESIISEGNNPTAAIDKFNEIVTFLNSIENTDTLAGLLADIVNQIPTNVSDLQNDAGYITSHQNLDGKQDVIDSSHKLSSDLVDDANKTHKFVTSQEKDTWNGKSDFSGDYNDLSNRPTIPTIPTNVSSFTNDSHYVVENDIQTTVPSEYYVDMGLPSGTLWAKTNIDVTQTNGFAASEYQYDCTFFSWGNTDGHNPITNTTFDYNWGGVNQQEPWYEGQPYGSTPGSKLTGNIAPSADCARINLGAPWRLPTNNEYSELFTNSDFIDANGAVIASDVTNKLITMNSVVGIRIKSKINSNILFFPCSGHGTGTSRVYRGSYGLYWSSTWYSARSARYLNFYSGGVSPTNISYRYFGFAVRAVTSQANLVGNTITKTERNIWNNKANIWRGTQAEYDLIQTPDNNTIYIITSVS